MNDKISIKVEGDSQSKRLDVFLADKYTKFSRSKLQKEIKSGKILVNDGEVTPHYKLKIGDVIKLTLPEQSSNIPEKEDIPLEIEFENNDIAVVYKPSGMVVHPTEEGKHLTGTLVNALLNHFGKKGLSDLGGELRPGILHRLDKDTSGILIVAKNNTIHSYLIELMKARKIEKKYIALVKGHLKHETGTIDSPLSRATRDRKKISLSTEGEGREAITEYKVKDYYEDDNGQYSLVEVKILTGRTHQIRVHFSSIGHPVVGDELYGNKKLNRTFKKLERQFLHAAELKFELPNGEEIYVKRKLPSDLMEVLDSLTQV